MPTQSNYILDLPFLPFLYICNTQKCFLRVLYTMGKKHNLHVGRIHADWCGHCVSLKGEWNKLKNMFRHHAGRSLKNVTIDHHDFEDSEDQKMQGHFVDKELEKYNRTHLEHSNVKVALQGGFPTIFRVLNGQLEYYNGERVAPSLFSWFSRGIVAQSGGKKNTKRKRVPKKGSKTRARRN